MLFDVVDGLLEHFFQLDVPGLLGAGECESLVHFEMLLDYGHLLLELLYYGCEFVGDGALVDILPVALID